MIGIEAWWATVPFATTWIRVPLPTQLGGTLQATGKRLRPHLPLRSRIMDISMEGT